MCGVRGFSFGRKQGSVLVLHLVLGTGLQLVLVVLAMGLDVDRFICREGCK